MNKKKYHEKIKRIKMIIMDVDGVLTDAGLVVGHDGFEYIRFNVHDGAGIVMAQKMGYRFGILTGRNTPIVDRRAEMLHIKDVFQNEIFKIDSYRTVLRKHHLQNEQVCYIGDDILDIPVLEEAGFSVAPANAVSEVKKYVDYVTEKCGGDGAVREVIDLVLDVTGRKKELIRQIKEKTLPIYRLS